MSAYTTQTILDIQHWTENLFSFRTTRDPGFRFRSGEFTMIGLEGDFIPVKRAYSIASAIYDEHLEFYSIKVPNGPLTSRLQHVKPGDKLLVGKKAVGTLVTDNLLPGRRLYLLATGTGFAPFASLLKDPAIYELYEQVILVHSTRHVAELGYANQIIEQIRGNDFLAEFLQRLFVYQTVTQDTFENIANWSPVISATSRITNLIYTGKLFDDLKQPPLNPLEDRVMICGNPNMMNELSEHLKLQGFEMGSASERGHYVIEKAFAEK